ncbi:hypothetical protein FSP39_019187 [Pinctada imbricata]|uniref:Uncharacterized protein n=1 Tax=Pinctada imbricata TaxID=66713 RepID=A0AA88XS55_PINIB|nr:hypothetical protein FSP39_019187 [Pinctada imbricata]
MMSSPRYDFVGVSSTQLPYVHDSFPAGPKVGTIRYYTMRSMHRGKDAERKNAISLQRSQSLRLENKEMINLKLPKLSFDLHHRQQPHDVQNTTGHINYTRKTLDLANTTGNIYRQKAYFRLKGIALQQVYSLHRTKTDRFENTHIKRRHTINDTKKDPRRGKNFPSISRNENTPTESITGTEVSTESDGCESPLRKSRLEEMDRESPVPGVRSLNKGKPGRKLGNIVSSRRLQQLLDNDDVIDPGAFYYY